MSVTGERPEAPATSERRREVLRAVSDLIARHGIDGMSMRQVADAVGMSTGTINYHFKNKRGLIMAAMDHVYSAPQDWSRYENLGQLEQLRIRAGIFVLRSESRQRWGRFWIEYAAHAGRDGELLESHKERHQRRRDVFAQTIADGQKTGEVRRDIDPVGAAETLLAVIDGVTTQQIAFGLSPERAEAILSGFISHLGAHSAYPFD
jgi:AcrR family transcriptional regulator